MNKNYGNRFGFQSRANFCASAICSGVIFEATDGLVGCGRELAVKLTQEEFAARFHLPLGTVRNWEQGAHRPDKAAQVLLTVIAKEPDAVTRALEREPA